MTPAQILKQGLPRPDPLPPIPPHPPARQGSSGKSLPAPSRCSPDSPAYFLLAPQECPPSSGPDLNRA